MKMMKHIFLQILLSIPVLSFIGCKEEPTKWEPDRNLQDSGPAIEIEVSEFDDLLSRSVENPKTKFTEGDVIHIGGEFSDGTTSTYRYGAMKLMNNKWVPVDEKSALKWPLDAVSGNFTAYYICDGKGDLLSGSLSGTAETIVDLSDLQNDKDPLKAETNNVDYGHTVRLTFKHLCTHLTFTELDYGVTNQYWLVKPGNNTESGLKNAFSFGLSSDNKLSFNFISRGDEDFDGLVYINRQYFNMPEEDGVRVSYFLEPGDYSHIELRSANNHPYLTWTSDNTGNLEENKTYTVNVQQSTGVTITEDTEVEWDDDDSVEVDPETFLKAIKEQNDYFLEDGTQILRAVENGMLLLHCVSFKEKDKEYYDGFFADNPSGKVFDGNFHYISDLSFPLFRYNYGTIQNLGIKDVNTTVTSIDFGNDYDKDRSRQGCLCRWNQGGSIIHNVRLENISLTVRIQNSIADETHNAGCLTGVNSGNISSVFTKGNYTMTIKNDDGSTGTISTVITGGLIGQNVGVVSDISPLEDGGTIITVKNECNGNSATYMMGGAVGLSSGLLDHIIVPNVNITSSSESNGAIGYYGGLAGNLRTEVGNPSRVEACMVGGSVKEGKISQYGNIISFSYTGGIAGAVMNFSILNSRSVCEVIGITNLENNVAYGCGGGFGRIISAQEIADLTIYGNTLTGVGNVGCFAGIAPSGYTWENTYSKSNNFVKKFDNWEYIGKNED